MSKKDDLYFIERIRKGDSEAFKFLVDRHKDMIFSIILRIVRINEDAEELAQDTFIKAYQSLDSFKGKSKFSTWLYRIGYNIAVSHTRKRNLDTVNVDDNILSDDEIFETYSEFVNKEKEEKNVILGEALKMLKEDEELLITLYYLKELSIKEIVKITDLTHSNIKVKLFRARNKLFSILNEKKDMIFAL